MTKHILSFPFAFLLQWAWLAVWPIHASLYVQIYMAVIIAFAIVWTGTKHAWIYNKEAGSYKPFKHYEDKRKEFIYHKLEIHNTQYLGEYTLFGLAIFGGCPPLVVFGAQFVARLPFQGLINWATGKPFIDPNENNYWGQVNPKPKFLPGRWSILKPIIGIILIYIGLTWK